MRKFIFNKMQDTKDLSWEHPVFKVISEAARHCGCRCYVIGGYVRDFLLKRKSVDIDIVCTGGQGQSADTGNSADGPRCGIMLAKEVRSALGKQARLSVFKNFGTAQVAYKGLEIEFVGARKESYRSDSRKPIVENGTLEDDQNRRDFTINALAISLNADDYGTLADPFGGVRDLENKLIRTPLDPDITFSDDPLRMFRAIRFASQLDFRIEDSTFDAISRNRERMSILSAERITSELNKIILSEHPSRGFIMLDKAGLLELVLPEMTALKGTEVISGKGHKDVFLHSLAVLDNVAAASGNPYLRWAALLHDTGKAVTKHFDEKNGWTFRNHDYIGTKIVFRIFKRLKLPLNENLRYVQKIVGLHMRPIVLVEDKVTDSAVRRLLFEAGNDIEDLMILCKADITTKNENKQKQYRENLSLVEQKLKDIEQKDHVRNFQPPVDGAEIMKVFNLPPCAAVGTIKSAIKDAILDGKIPNDHEAAYRLMIEEGAKLGLAPALPVQA